MPAIDGCGAFQLTRLSQCERLLALLKSRSGWVGLDEILGLRIGQYNTRILELRRSGYVIENRTVRSDDQLLSSYRLVSEGQKQKIQTATPHTSVGFLPPLFSDSELQFSQQWRDPEE